MSNTPRTAHASPTPSTAAPPAVVPDTASLCPLCGTNNGCAVSAGADPASCWCMNSVIAPAALARAKALRPAGTPASQCICPACGALTSTPPD